MESNKYFSQTPLVPVKMESGHLVQDAGTWFCFGLRKLQGPKIKLIFLKYYLW